MQFKHVKGLVLATSAIVGLSFAATSANAADSATMGVSVEAIDAVDVEKLNDMNFGKWLIDHDGTEDIVIVLDPTDNSATVTPALTTSAAQQIAGTSRSGRLEVTIPAGINNYELTMTVDNPTAFTDASAYALTAVSYATASDTMEADVDTTGATDYPVTVVTGGTPEVVYFGGELTISDNPAATGVDDTAGFDVTFAY
jgi:hypothetical protein